MVFFVRAINPHLAQSQSLFRTRFYPIVSDVFILSLSTSSISINWPLLDKNRFKVRKEKISQLVLFHSLATVLCWEKNKIEVTKEQLGDFAISCFLARIPVVASSLPEVNITPGAPSQSSAFVLEENENLPHDPGYLSYMFPSLGFGEGFGWRNKRLGHCLVSKWRACACW